MFSSVVKLDNYLFWFLIELDTYHNSVVILRLALHLVCLPSSLIILAICITAIGYLVYNSTHL